MTHSLVYCCSRRHKLPICCSMTMSGKVVACVAEVWDDQLVAGADGRAVTILGLDPTDATDFLSAKTYAAYIAHGTPHDVVMYEMYTKVIIPRATIIKDRAKALAELQRSGQQHGAFAPAPSVVRAFEGSPSTSSRRSRASTQSSSRSLPSPDRRLRPRIGSPVASSSEAQQARQHQIAADLMEANPAIQAVQFMEGPAPAQLPPSAEAVPPQRLSANSNGGRRVVLEGDSSSDDDADAEQVISGTWSNDPAEFDLVLALDGDNAPLAAFMDKQKMRSYVDDKHPRGRQTIQELIMTKIWGNVCLLKWSAGCSMLQSPNDVGKTHWILRCWVKGKKKGKKTVAKTLQECEPGLQAHHRYLHNPAISITAARKRGFWRLLSNLPSAVAEAFRERVVRSSWALCGYYPLSNIMILEKCSLWKKKTEDGGLSHAEKCSVLAAIPSLRDIAYRKGRVSDLEMAQALPFLDRYPTGLNYDLSDLSINRDRCSLVIHPSYLSERVVAGVAARDANAGLKRPKKAKPKNSDRLPYELWTPQSCRCTVAIVKEQLNMRGVALGRAKDKTALLALWETHSSLPDKRAPVRVAAPRGGGEARVDVRVVGGAAAVADAAAHAAAAGQ
jgi:hypothetical protein